MIFRIFMILFAVNMAVFWVKAHASEPNPDTLLPALQVTLQSQAATTRSLPSYEREQTLAELGARLLRWEFKGRPSHALEAAEHHPAHRVSMIPSISILPDGAAFNMRWRF